LGKVQICRLACSFFTKRSRSRSVIEEFYCTKSLSLWSILKLI